MAIILASKSPRRQELLRLLGLDFIIMTEDVDERMDPALPPAGEVARVSEKKAAAVLPQVAPEDLVITDELIAFAAEWGTGIDKDTLEARDWVFHKIKGD